MKKEVAAEDEAHGAVAVPEPGGCLSGVDEAIGPNYRLKILVGWVKI